MRFVRLITCFHVTLEWASYMYILAYVVPFDVGIQDIWSPAIFQIQVEVVLHSPDIDRLKRGGPIRARFA